jgi:hypothetical protein
MGYTCRRNHDLAASRLNCGIADCKSDLTRQNNEDFLVGMRMQLRPVFWRCFEK